MLVIHCRCLKEDFLKMEKLPAVGVFALLLGEEKGHQSEQTSITRFPVSDFTKDEDADNDCQEVDQGKSF